MEVVFSRKFLSFVLCLLINKFNFFFSFFFYFFSLLFVTQRNKLKNNYIYNIISNGIDFLLFFDRSEKIFLSKILKVSISLFKSDTKFLSNLIVSRLYFIVIKRMYFKIFKVLIRLDKYMIFF